MGVHMSVDQFVRILEALAKLLSAIAWPLFGLFVVLRFRDGIRSFFASLSEVSFKGAGLEASAKRSQIQAAATIAAAAATDQRDPTSPREAARAATEVVLDSLSSKAVRKARHTRVLWVDDKPDNNIAEQQALEALGIKVVNATSTDQALQLLDEQRFDLIISDMGRPPDERAGYTLLERVRARRVRLPYLLYAAGGNTPNNRAEALRRGAQGSTNRPTELFELIFGTLGAH